MPENYQIKPLYSTGLADYHCHPNYSVDAVGTIDEYCEAARSRNLVEICFTTHFDTNPDSIGDEDNVIVVRGEKLPATVDNLAVYVEDVRWAHDKYYPLGLSVKLGVEVGWYPGCEKIVTALKERYDFDHVLCGIHELNNVCFCCRNRYEKCFAGFDSMAAMLEAYFREVAAAARTGLFDCIAHFDYYKKYGEKHYGAEINSGWEPYAEDIFAVLKRSETALEVNTAGLRKGNNDYYPAIKIVNAARKAGVTVAFLGSDAHAPNEIGYDFDAASALVPPDICLNED
ncbi:MAG: histidinol-phosphatase HisJ family protein [Candidatus Zixiibacteriota bacterium]